MIAFEERHVDKLFFVAGIEIQERLFTKIKERNVILVFQLQFRDGLLYYRLNMKQDRPIGFGLVEDVFFCGFHFSKINEKRFGCLLIYILLCISKYFTWRQKII